MPPRLVSEVLPKLLNPIFGKKNALFGKMLTHWGEIVGEDVSDKVFPLSIKTSRPRKNKKQGEGEEPSSTSSNTQATLILAVRPAFALEMTYQKLLLQEKINIFFGYEAVKEIKFIQNSSITDNKKPPPPRTRPLSLQEIQSIERLCEKVQESDLQTSLKNLGKAILSRKKREEESR